MTDGATGTIWEDFGPGAAARWDFVADGVMGGVSDGAGGVAAGALWLRGRVSTDNNGGFLQVRRRFEGGFPAGTTGLRLSVRGNGADYWVFLKTAGLARVWHSYRAGFGTGADWAQVLLPLADFAPSHGDMARGFAPGNVTSVAIVAYGRDFEAEVSLREIALV